MIFVADEAPPQSSEDPRRLYGQWEALQRELQRIQDRMVGLEQAMMELQQARAAIEALQETGTEGTTDALVPLGGGIQVSATVDVAKPLLVPLGAGYATEGDADRALAHLKTRMESTSAAYEAASREADKLSNAAQNMANHLALIQQQAAGSSAANA